MKLILYIMQLVAIGYWCLYAITLLIRYMIRVNKRKANIYEWFFRNQDEIKKHVAEFLCIDEEQCILIIDSSDNEYILGDFVGRDCFGKITIYINNIEKMYSYNWLSKIKAIITVAHEMVHFKQFINNKDIFNKCVNNKSYLKDYYNSPIEAEARDESMRYIVNNLKFINYIIKK